MNIKDAVNSPEFEIFGLNAENFNRFLTLRAIELSTDEHRGSWVKAPTQDLKIEDVKTYKDARKMVGEVLLKKRVV